MLCQNCKQNPATIYYTKIMNGNRIDIRLCDKCAKENNIDGYNYNFSSNDFLTSFFDIPIKYSINSKSVESKNILKCEKCGLTFEEFKQSGKFGCSQCYLAFKDKLIPILKRLHGNVQHKGKIPSRSDGKIKTRREIEKLRKELDNAVKQENFEEAAKLRDTIKEIENTTKNKG